MKEIRYEFKQSNTISGKQSYRRGKRTMKESKQEARDNSQCGHQLQWMIGQVG